MSSQEINYTEVNNWLKEYHLCQNETKKQQLLNMIVLTCIPIVKKIVFSLARRFSDPIEDIIQVGTIGLIKAIHKYNPSYENAKSYLFYSIFWEIKHHLRTTALQEGATYTTIELAIRADKFDVEQIDEDDLSNFDREKNPTKKVMERRRIVSLDELQFTDENNNSTLMDKISDDKDLYLQEFNENKMILDKAIKQLPEKLQDLVQKLYFDGYSQVQLAKKWNTPQSNISRMQKRAIGLLVDIIGAKNITTEE